MYCMNCLFLFFAFYLFSGHELILRKAKYNLKCLMLLSGRDGSNNHKL